MTLNNLLVTVCVTLLLNCLLSPLSHAHTCTVSSLYSCTLLLFWHILQKFSALVVPGKSCNESCCHAMHKYMILWKNISL